jgi:hypothetical protein
MSEQIGIYIKNINKYFFNIDYKFKLIEFSKDNYSNYIYEIEDIFKNIENILKKINIDNMDNKSSLNDVNDSPEIKTLKNKLSKYKLKLKKIKEKLNYKNRNNFNLDNEKLLYNSYNKLNLISRTTSEIEDISKNTLFDLNNHSNKMKNIKIKLNDMDDDLNLSSNLLNKMIKTNSRNKIIILSFGIFLFILILLIFLYKLFK